MKNFVLALCCLLVFSYCQPRETVSPPVQGSASGTTSTIRYAKRFALEPRTGYTLVHVFGNKDNFDTTASWAVYTGKKPTLPGGIPLLQSPCRRIAALSSIYAAMLWELGAMPQLVAIDNIDYVNNAELLKKHSDGHLAELAKGPELDLEGTIALHPDVVFTFGSGGTQEALYSKLEKAGIPVAVSLDHLEQSPLARAEWIKFYALFAGKRQQGDSIFAEVEKKYLALKARGAGFTKRPTVFSEIKYGDVWYVPGGKSFMAQLISDAGADYVWRADTHTGSLPLSLEEVYTKAKNADYWINLSGVRSVRDLQSQEPRYAEFAAFAQGRLYNNDRVTNTLGYSTYWETGMAHPERIVSDLLHIFHGNAAGGSDSLYYYRKLP